MRGNQAFTLVELLVVMGIIGVLIAVLVPTLNQARKSSESAAAISQMRQIGAAIFHYTTDSAGLLPGPLKPDQGANYVPGNTDQLASALAPYLGVTDLTKEAFVSAFLTPGFVRVMGSSNLEKSRPFVMNISFKVNDQKFTPWGSTAAPPASPMQLAAVPMSVWVFADADQLNPAVKGMSWADRTPEKILNGAKRLALFLNGSVGPIEESTLNAGEKKPPPPPPPPPPRP